jgi:hypothetical protein
LIFKLINRQARMAAMEAIEAVPDGWICRVTDATRSLDQNAKLWPLLTDISSQVIWYGQRLNPDDWKSVFTAALKKSRVVPGLDGGFVVCGQSTSGMGKAEFSELLDLIMAFGAEHEVEWSEHEIAS